MTKLTLTSLANKVLSSLVFSLFDITLRPVFSTSLFFFLVFIQEFVMGSNYTFLTAILMLMFDLVFYLFLVWYLENVMPGEFGVPKPYYFFLQSRYWYCIVICIKSMCNEKNICNCAV